MITKFIDYLVLTKGYSQNTARLYESELRAFAKAQNGRRWSQITSNDIILYLSNKKATGASNNTIIANISAIRGIYNWMSRNYHLEVNPAKYIETPKREKTIPHTIDAKAIAQAVEGEDNKDIKLAIMLMASVGLRVSEVRGMKYEDINISTSSVRILGKGKKERLVYLPTYITETIKERKKQEGEIFAGWQDRNFRYAIFQSFARIGVRCSPHMLRHSFAEQAINKGMRLDVLREVLGHTSIATTEIYLHANNNVVRSEYDKIYS